jgi:ribosomal protein L5
MKNAKELRVELAAVFESLRNGDIETKTAAELANLAGKMISSAKTQVEYYALRREQPNIQFLNEEEFL